MKLKKFFKDRENYLIALLVSFLSFIPISTCPNIFFCKIGIKQKVVDSPRVDIAVWTVIIIIIIEIYSQRLKMEVQYASKNSPKGKDVVIKMDKEKRQEFSIEIELSNLRERNYKKEIVFTFPVDVAITGNRLKEDKYAIENVIRVPLGQLSNNAISILKYSIVLEENSLSGTQKDIRCETNFKVKHVKERNKLCIFWR